MFRPSFFLLILAELKVVNLAKLLSFPCLSVPHLSMNVDPPSALLQTDDVAFISPLLIKITLLAYKWQKHPKSQKVHTNTFPLGESTLFNSGFCISYSKRTDAS